MTWTLSLAAFCLLVVCVIVGMNFWMLLQLSRSHSQLHDQLRVILKNLSLWDQPDSLAQSGVEPGTSWIATDGEMKAMQARMEAESTQRTGSPVSRRTSAKRMASPMASSPSS